MHHPVFASALVLSAVLSVFGRPTIAAESPELTLQRYEPPAPDARAACLFDSASGTWNGNYTLQGPAATVGITGFTRLLASDVTIATGGLPVPITQFSFSVYNANANPVSARARIRFWLPDGTPIGTPNPPGTYYNDGVANIGFTFAPISFAPGIAVYLANAAFTWPASGTLWAGITFDDNSGLTGATLAELSNLGQGSFTGGLCANSSGDGFLTTSAGSFFPVSNPAGARLPLPLPPPGQLEHPTLGWSFVPEPGTITLAAIGMLLFRRRMK